MSTVVPDHIQLMACQRPVHGDERPVAHWRLWTLLTVNHFCTECVLGCNMIWDLDEGWRIEFDIVGYLKTDQIFYQSRPPTRY